MNYETLNEQEWLALLTEMAKADNVIKKRLAKVLVNKSEFFSRQDTQAVMHLYADNVDTGKSVTLDTTNNWEYTFTGLRKYNGNQEIQYSIKEDEMNFYMTSIAGDMENGFNVTNTWNEQHELPGDAPTVEIPEFKITTFVNTTEENGIRTHIYKKHTLEQSETPNNNTTPVENSTITGNKIIVEHTVPTGDNMMNILKLFALSMLGLGFALFKRKDLKNE